MCGYEFICVVANEVDLHSHCQVRLLVLLQGLEHIDAGAAFERVIPLFGPVAIQEDISVDTLAAAVGHFAYHIELAPVELVVLACAAEQVIVQLTDLAVLFISRIRLCPRDRLLKHVLDRKVALLISHRHHPLPQDLLPVRKAAP